MSEISWSLGHENLINEGNLPPSLENFDNGDPIQDSGL